MDNRIALVIRQGDTIRVTIEVFDGDAKVSPAKLRWRATAGWDVVLDTEQSLEDAMASGGIVRVAGEDIAVIPADQTADLPVGGHRHEAKAELSDGRIATVFHGPLRVEGSLIGAALTPPPD